MFDHPSYRRWFIQGTIGILLFGFGLCLFSEASFFRRTDPPAWQWVGFGTLSLVVVMAGLILIVDSVRFRIRYENDRENH